MALSSRTKQILSNVFADPQAGTEVSGTLATSGSLPQSLGTTDIPTFGGVKVGTHQVVGAQQALVQINGITVTSGALPTVTGTTTVADATNPTTVELLNLHTQLRSKVNAIILALQAHGLTSST